jgi:hypothetical protein
MNFLDLNNTLKQEALDLLTTTGVLDTLRANGTPHFHGGYRLDVMAWREVDIYQLMDPLTSARVYSLLADIDKCIHPAEMFLMDQLNHPRRRGPGNAFHIDLRTKPTETPGCWKIDIWCVTPSGYQGLDQFEARLQESLDSEKRAAIIEIKERFHLHPGYRRGVWVHHKPAHFFSSSDVFDAVIESRVRSFSEFSDHIYSKHGVRIEDELPNNRMQRTP